MQSFLLILLSITLFIFIIQTVAGISLPATASNSERSFTVRNGVSFLTGFFAMCHASLSAGNSLITAICMGLMFGSAFAGASLIFIKSAQLYFQRPHKPAYSGLIAQAVKNVPSARGGRGMVELNIRTDGIFNEMIAVTDDNEDIEASSHVRVVKQLENGVLLVQKLYIN